MTTDLSGNGGCCITFGLAAVQYSWQQDFIIEGAQGSGFVIPRITGPCENAGGIARLSSRSELHAPHCRSKTTSTHALTLEPTPAETSWLILQFR